MKKLLMSLHKVMISGGGTGGHVFPALAIANKLQERHPHCEVLFVGARNRMEMEKVPAAGYPIKGLWISGLQRALTVHNLLFPVKLMWSVVAAFFMVKRFQPEVVVGTGGYASGPILWAASFLGIPTLIQEQNSFPGITNKLLAKKVNKICVAYTGLARFFPKEKIVETGNPVRKAIQKKVVKKEGCAQFGLDVTKPVLLVIGGSLGAGAINTAIEKQLSALVKKGVQVIWQTGKLYIDACRVAAAPFASEGVVVCDFITQMDMAYGAADVVVSRAGAIAVSELCVVGKPCILVPSPNVSEDHQTHNARALVEKKAAILLPEKDLNTLLLTLLALFATPKKLEALGVNCAALARPDADAKIVAEIEKIVARV